MKIPFLSRLTGAPRDAAPRPLPNSYWVAQWRLLAGEYPGDEELEVARTRLAALLGAGIDTFVDLTQDDECAPYAQLLPPNVRHHRLAIEDHSLPRSHEQMHEILGVIREALERDRCIYVHCRAGIGRTGTVIACHLALAGGLDGEAALAELNRLWKQSARSAQWRRVPETEEQQQFVLEYVAAGAALPATPGPPEPGESPGGIAEDDTDPLFSEDALGAARRLRERFLGAWLGMAAGDALAAPTQLARPGSVAAVRDLIGGGVYDLPRGAWTDDTAMALCLAESLLERKAFDPRDQVARYRQWQREGHLSATGQCIGITGGASKALAAAGWRRQAFAGSHDPNQLERDPLTRVLPVVMWRFAQPREAIAQAAEAARPTCQAPDVLAACRFLAAALHAALSGRPRSEFLQPDPAAWQPPKGSTRLAALASGAWRERSVEALRPAGDALDLLEAALWAVHRAKGWRDGALLAANLGGDCDTIATLYGQLAGAHFGVSGIPAAWRDALARRELLVEFGDRLLAEAMVGLGELT